MMEQQQAIARTLIIFLIEPSIAWLSNSSEFDRDTFNVAEAVADLFVPVKSPEQQAAAVTEVSVPEEILKPYTGWYRNPRTGAGVKFFMSNGKWQARRPGK